MSQPRAHLLTAADLAELERHEIVDGELVRKASPVIRHSITQTRIGGLLRGFWGGEAGGPGGWWIGAEPAIELAPHEVYQPDIAGWRIDRTPVIPDDWPIRLVPDWMPPRER